MTDEELAVARDIALYWAANATAKMLAWALGRQAKDEHARLFCAFLAARGFLLDIDKRGNLFARRPGGERLTLQSHRLLARFCFRRRTLFV